MKFNIFIFLTGVLLFISCNKDFDQLNTNPNAPTEVSPELLLRQVIYSLGDEMSYEGFVAGNLLGQHFTMIDFNLFDRHALSDPQLGGNPWPMLYRNLRDNQNILSLAENSEVSEVYRGPALVLKAYIASLITDVYGDAPYTEAVNGLTGNVTPVYDTQEDIYTASGGILDNLEQAILALEGY